MSKIKFENKSTKSLLLSTAARATVGLGLGALMVAAWEYSTFIDMAQNAIPQNIPDGTNALSFSKDMLTSSWREYYENDFIPELKKNVAIAGGLGSLFLAGFPALRSTGSILAMGKNGIVKGLRSLSLFAKSDVEKEFVEEVANEVDEQKKEFVCLVDGNMVPMSKSELQQKIQSGETVHQMYSKEGYDNEVGCYTYENGELTEIKGYQKKEDGTFDEISSLKGEELDNAKSSFKA